MPADRAREHAVDAVHRLEVDLRFHPREGWLAVDEREDQDRLIDLLVAAYQAGQEEGRCGRDKLRSAALAALAALNNGRCPRCLGRGEREVECPYCADSTCDHVCPPNLRCAPCEGAGYPPAVLKLRDLLGDEP